MERFGKDGKVTSRFTSHRYAPPDWQAHAWLLERRDPARWGKRLRDTPTGEAAAADVAGALPTWLDLVTPAQRSVGRSPALA